MKAGVTIAIVAVIYLLRIDPYAGLMIDDAWYMVLGKALSMGEGFRLISSSVTPIMPSLPPGFPAILSFVFWLSPSYPDNVFLLKAVSVIAMAGVGVACWYDFTRNRAVPHDHALWMAAAAVLTPAFVFLATSTVMAEGVFTLAQLLTVIAVERAMRRDADDTRGPIAAGALAAAATFVRTAGLAAVAAAVVYFLVHRRWRQGSVFAVTVAALVLPWQLYARSNAPSPEERMAHGGSIAYSYDQLIAMERPGAADTAVTGERFALRSVRNVEDILTRDIGAVVLPVLYRGASESGQETISIGRPGRGSMGSALGTRILSGLLALIMMVGVYRTRAWMTMPVLLIAASLAMIATVGSQTFRYVLPLAPFLLLFLWRGLWQPAAARIFVLVVLGFHLLDHSFYIHQKLTGTPDWIAGAGEIDQVLSFMETNLHDDGAVASSNPGLAYLRTGRKGIFSINPARNWEQWRASGVTYVAALRRTEMPSRRWNATVLFQTEGRLWIVRM